MSKFCSILYFHSKSTKLIFQWFVSSLKQYCEIEMQFKQATRIKQHSPSKGGWFMQMLWPFCVEIEWAAQRVLTACTFNALSARTRSSLFPHPQHNSVLSLFCIPHHVHLLFYWITRRYSLCAIIIAVRIGRCCCYRAPLAHSFRKENQIMVQNPFAHNTHRKPLVGF